jgi:DNA-binding IclR family transcriptional regulator
MQIQQLSRSLSELNVVDCGCPETDRVVKSASRVLKILELFDVLRREAPVSEVSELLTLPQSSTSALLHSMAVMGYLYCNPKTRAFSPTTRVALLGSWVNGSIMSDGLLMGLIQRVNARTKQAVVVAVRNRVWSEYIHVVQSPSPVRLFMVKGSRRQLIRSGTGLVLLSDLPDSDIKRIAVRTNSEAAADEPQTCIATLLDQVGAVRKNGWASTFDTITKGGGMIATRLPALNHKEQLVIGIAGITDDLCANRDSYIGTLIEEVSAYAAGQKSGEASSAAH